MASYALKAQKTSAAPKTKLTTRGKTPTFGMQTTEMVNPPPLAASKIKSAPAAPRTSPSGMFMAGPLLVYAAPTTVVGDAHQCGQCSFIRIGGGPE
jgi:hypothetical protein